ncbi:uncharacterized protein TNCV_1567771 [Trichonephila clavipes]|nr:uncharacterized protein TNCV_1567771 [Trichonephila clavipes]
MTINSSSLYTGGIFTLENLTSDQLKKFWDFEVSGLIDSKNKSDVSENHITKNFESNIKYYEKPRRCKVGLPWELEARELKDNTEIPEKRFTRLRKRFQKNPHLFLEYREVLQNYFKLGIIELVPYSDSDSNNVTIYLPHREVIRKDRRRIFVPIGVLGPFTLRIKHLMQKVWLLGVQWDECFSDDVISR